MSARLAVLVVSLCLSPADTVAQAPADLTRQQRELLSALVTAVDRSTARSSGDHEWQTHALRASDGSHYLAISVTPGATVLAERPVLIYVRLATTPVSGETTAAERSLVREWLQGSRTDPRLLPRRGGMAIGEMPVMGAGGIAARGAAVAGSADLQTMAMQRERARQRKEDEEKRRRESLESAAAAATDRFPFEDFEVGLPSTFADGTRAIQRALTAGPGSYDLVVAWADAGQSAAKATVHVARQSLQLAPARNEFGLSSVIVADQIGVRQVPYSALEQRAHPYAIGATEILPARDAVFTPAERIAVAFQIINPMASPSGKPDVRVELRIARFTGMREEPLAALSPLTYNDSTLPAEFDVRLGHPLIAALSAPLATVPRGQYRLLITAEDRVSGSIVSGKADFSVVGTPASLLAEAPPLGPRFDVADVLQVPIVTALVDRLAPSAHSSPALAKALDAARAGRFTDLLIEDAVPEAERGVRAALTVLGLLSVGDLGAIAQFERALQLGSDPAPLQFLVGAARALQQRDPDAVAAWQSIRDAVVPKATIDRQIAEAYLRRKDFARASAAIGGSEAVGQDAAATRTLAATRIATRREAEAVAALDALLVRRPDDPAARWLLLHALFADFVHGNHAVVERLRAEGPRYIAAQGAHAALLSEWLKILP